MHTFQRSQLIGQRRAAEPGGIHIALFECNEGFVESPLSRQGDIAQRDALCLEVFIPQVRQKSAPHET
ncbi:hypothetical protein D3C73_1048090 [compost metagenome]